MAFIFTNGFDRLFDFLGEDSGGKVRCLHSGTSKAETRTLVTELAQEKFDVGPRQAVHGRET